MHETNFFWDPLSDCILQERDESGAVTAEYTAEPGLYGNVISQNQGGLEHQLHYDALGSTLALTNSIQHVTNSFSFTGYGEAAERTVTVEAPFQYIGQKAYYLDELTEEYLVRRRAYNPFRARWDSVDPLHPSFHSVNAFVYTRAPLIHVDPSGLLCYSTEEYSAHRDCDAFGVSGAIEFWAIQWNLQPPERNGFIIQKIEARSYHENCNTGEFEVSAACPGFRKKGISTTTPPHAESLEYWEFWIVRGGKIVTGRPGAVELSSGQDLFARPGIDGTFGFDDVRAFAYFVSTEPNDPMVVGPPGGWETWKYDPAGTAGFTNFACNSPSFKHTIYKPAAIRSMNAKWWCCDCENPLFKKGIDIQKIDWRGQCP